MNIVYMYLLQPALKSLTRPDWYEVACQAGSSHEVDHLGYRHQEVLNPLLQQKQLTFCCSMLTITHQISWRFAC